MVPQNTQLAWGAGNNPWAGTDFCRPLGLFIPLCYRSLVWQQIKILPHSVFQPLVFTALSQCLTKGFTQHQRESPAICLGNRLLPSSLRKCGSWSEFSLHDCVGQFFIHLFIYFTNTSFVSPSCPRHCVEYTAPVHGGGL